MLRALAFVLVLFPTTMVVTISFCSTQIWIDGVGQQFHVDIEEDLERSAARFCASHNIVDAVECQRIIDYHRTTCFTSTKVSSSSSGIHGFDREKVYEAPVLPTVTVKPVPRAAPKVDFSQRVGPVLSVYHGSNGQSTSMQAYLGETKDQAVTRFCKMMTFNEKQCTEVDTAYTKLLQREKEELSITSGSGGVIRPTITTGRQAADLSSGSNSNGNSGNSGGQTAQDQSLDNSGWFKQGSDVIREYWRYVLLLAGIMYVYLAHQQQQEDEQRRRD